MRTSLSAASFAALLGLSFGACTARRAIDGNCVFNDDCVSPLVCSANRCRSACRTDRDCPSGQLCAPGDDPSKRVCVAPTAQTQCAGDTACPSGATCAGGSCWWLCGDDAACAARSAGMCLSPEGVCATPVTAQQQREQAREGGVSTDAAPDARPDSGPDAGPEAGPDAGPELTPEAAVDAAPDAPSMDAALEAGPDAAADVVEAATDGGAPCGDASDCFFAHASGMCVAGRCELALCMGGYTDCDGNPNNGCEVATGTDTANCGTCGHRCNPAPGTASPVCSAGVCRSGACGAGFGDCNMLASDGCEEALAASTSNCGVCGNACPDFTSMGAVDSVCTSGLCGFSACSAGRGDCDGNPLNGCEASLQSSLAHCGGCGMACTAGPQATPACTAGRCVRTCAAGFADCDRTSANGCEVDTNYDPENCGGCAMPCPGDQVCSAGACVASPTTALGSTMVFAPTGDVSLPSGVYRYRSVSIPAGVRVSVGAPGILQLYVRGEVRIDGTLDVSGGAGGDGGPADAATCTGGNGGGGETGTGVAGVAGNTMSFGQPGGSGEGSAGTDGAQAVGGAGQGGTYGGGSGGPPRNVGAAGGGGGFAGGGGGGGEAGCTFCAAGSGGGGGGGAGAGGGGGGRGGNAGLSNTLYDGTPGASSGPGVAGGGGGASIGSVAGRDLAVTVSSFHTGSGGGAGGAPAGTGGGSCAAARAVGGGGGGGGGGALWVASATRIVVSSTGRVLANGGRGGSGATAMVTGGFSSAAGGGGSGGVLVLQAPAVQVAGQLSAAGGARGASPLAPNGVGGAGGLGRIRVSVRADAVHCQLGGSWNPPLASGCTPTMTLGQTAVLDSVP